MRFVVFAAAVLAAGCGTASPRATTTPGDLAAAPGAEAFRAAEQFMAAARAGDWDQAAEGCDTPFLVGDGVAPKREDDRAALPAELKRTAGGFGTVVTKVALATPVRADNAPVHVEPRLAADWPAVVARWTAVVGPDLHLMSAGGETTVDPVRLLVRVREGKGRVVGMVRLPAAAP